MKRLSFLAVILMAICLFFMACSSDDSSSSNNGLKITSFSPKNGLTGTKVWIQGQNFGSSPTVKIGTANMTIDGTPTNNEIFAIIPDGATTGKISVTTANGDTYTGGEFEVTGDGESSFPIVDSLSDTELNPGDVLTISGSGFDPDATYIVTFSGNVQGTITEITENHLKVEVPEDAASGNITLALNNESDTIGSLNIIEAIIPELYIFNYSIDQLAQINIETGELTYIGEATPYGSNTRGAVIKDNEYVGFQMHNPQTEQNDPNMIRINLVSGEYSTTLIQYDGLASFDELIMDTEGQFYTFHDWEVHQVAKINPNDGSLTYIGDNSIPEYGNNTRGAVYHQPNNEYVGLAMDNADHDTEPTLVRINLESGEATIIPIPESELTAGKDFDDFTIDDDNNLYAFYSSEDVLVKIDIDTGELTRIGDNIGYGNNTRGMVYHPTTNEIIGFQAHNENQEIAPNLVRINLETGNATIVPISPSPNTSSFADLAIKK